MKGWSVTKNVRAFHEYSQEVRRRHSGCLHRSCGAYGLTLEERPYTFAYFRNMVAMRIEVIRSPSLMKI